MNKEQKKRFERGGWKVGTVADLFELTQTEEARIQMKTHEWNDIKHLRMSPHEIAEAARGVDEEIVKIRLRDPATTAESASTSDPDWERSVKTRGTP